MTCRCDTPAHPLPLDIAAGLSTLPRQVAGFREFRLAMLGDLRTHAALDGWRASGDGDLGRMLLEMWAIVCDTVSFYDQVLAQEGFLRTARLEESVRGLVDLLGYIPRPAVAATVELAVFAEGQQPVSLPAGTAFRSEALADGPPQRFELVAPATVHPWNNAWTLQRPVPTTAGAQGGPGVAPSALQLSRRAAVRAGDVLLVVPSPSSTTQNRARRALVVEANPAVVTFSAPLALSPSTVLSQIALWRATRSTSLWSMPYQEGLSAVDSGLRWVVLDGLHREFRVGERLILERGSELRWFSLTAIDEIQQKVKVGTDSSGNALYAWLPATRLHLDAGLNERAEGGSSWSSGDAGQIVVHHGLQPAGTPTASPSPTLTDDDPLVVDGEVLDSGLSPGRFALLDARERTAVVSGALDPSTRTLTRDGDDPGWEGSLSAPVQLWGNLVQAVRGETVEREVLGSGDASMANQRFTLKKSPLTYVSAETESGVASTLAVWVDGVRWREVRSFFGAGPTDPIYVVRLDPDGVATLIFGDGVHGSRLPTGAGNVVAQYRFGAGASVPPPGSIHQVARPVKGLRSVAQPASARGGADAEAPEQVRTLAPRSALVLGRAVSVLDLQALAAAVPGVRAVQTTWGWHGSQQRPVVQCWTAGTPAEGAVAARLRAMTDPTTPIAAEPARPLPSLLALQVATDPARVQSEVLDAVFSVLAAEGTGLLRVEQLGIGQTLYRSRLSAAVLAVPGALAIHFSAMLWLDAQGALRQWLQDGYGAQPGTGAYFDFEAGGVWLNGEVRRLG